MGEEVRGSRRTNWWSQNIHGDVKDDIGNGVAKELICMTHGYGKRRGDCLRKGGGSLGGGEKGGKLGQL